jgi:hypothetical protein
MEGVKEKVPLLNIIGPVGIGKTSVAFAISDIFQYDRAEVFPHALIDLDDVRRQWPAPKMIPLTWTLVLEIWHLCGPTIEKLAQNASLSQA